MRNQTNVDQPIDRAFFPFQYLVDFFSFLSDARDRIEILTYSDLAWEDDWNHEDHYRPEFDRWNQRMKAGDLDSSKIYLLIQHDVDRLPERTHALLREEEIRGIPSNVMIFRRQPDRRILKSTGRLVFKQYDLDYAELQRLEDKGFVIGYHSNAYEQALFDMSRAIEIFEDDVAELRQHFRIDFFCPHGGVRDSEGKSNSSMPLPKSLEASLRWVLNRFTVRFHGTFSDGGLRGTKPDRPLDLRAFVNTWKPGKRYRILLHPQHYHTPFYFLNNLAGADWYEQLLANYASPQPPSVWETVRLD